MQDRIVTPATLTRRIKAEMRYRSAVGIGKRLDFALKFGA
jgi:hypothetical protein